MIRITDEREVVSSEALRKKIIEDITSPENRARKDEAYKRHLCYKDKTSLYVVEALLKQFDSDTVREMAYSIANISIARKIIDKLARVYSNGVQRKVEPEAAQQAVDDVAKIVEMNKLMKRANRYLRAQHNTVVGVLPCSYRDGEQELYEIKVKAFQPHLYDVIENSDDREKAMFIILSNYNKTMPIKASLEPAKEGRTINTVQPSAVSDGKDQLIADKSEDLPKDIYVWWSKHYHFTTDEKGTILGSTDKGIVNPIHEMPFVNFALDQEDNFWSEGGDDIFDGAVKINCMITNMDHIGVTQGYGQFYMKGKNLPRMVKAGVNKSILLEHDKDDPTPEIGFASSDPKLEELKDQCIMYTALLLTTNNLSTRAVSTELNSAADAASGVALLIDKADSIEDVQDQREIFQTNEPEIYMRIQKWQAVYKNVLTDKMKKAMLPEVFTLTLKFVDARPIMSEKEKLEALNLRKELGINTMLDLIMLDDPSLTEKQAEDRLRKILEEKIKAGMKELTQPNPESGDPNEEDPAQDQEKKPDEKPKPGTGEEDAT